MILGWAHVLIALVALQRLAELARARYNTRALLARGGVESGAAHYPLFIVLHGVWLVTLFTLTDPNPEPRWGLLGLFAILQALRLWVIATLGPYWTTRIVTVPGAVPVRSGPYRYLRHPNYLIVALEMPTLPLALGLPWVALIFGTLNLALLSYRIRVEDRARAAQSRATLPIS
jgi:methyltransferase